MTSLYRAFARSPLFALLALVTLLLGACNQMADEGADEPAEGPDLSETLVSEDGAFEMKVPASWSQHNNLNDVAVLQAADLQREAYAILIADPKRPFEGTSLGSFADTQIQTFVESVADARMRGPELVIIDGEEALQYEVEGTADNVEVVYLYTFMETPDRFLKAVTWSLAGNYDRNEDTLTAVTESIRQLKPLEESPSPAASPDATLSPAPSPSPSPPSTPAATPSILERPV